MAGDHRFQIGVLVTLLVALAPGVPFSVEYGYLLPAYRLFHPDFLATDFTFGGPWFRNLIFNGLAGLPMAVLPLTTVASVGRIICWILLFNGFHQIGRRLAIPPGYVTTALTLWILVGQSLIGGETPWPSFAPSVVAWLCLLQSTVWIHDRRDIAGGVMLGLCVATHPAVGVSAAAGIAAALLMALEWRRLVRVGLTSLATAAPVLLAILPIVVGQQDSGREEWQYQALVRQPMHLDPAYFRWTGFATSIVLLAFVLLVTRSRAEDPSMKYLSRFFYGLLGLFALGLVSWVLGWYEMLRLFPFRVLPVFTLLVFFLLLFKVFRERSRHAIRPMVAATGFSGLLLLPNPLVGLRDQWRLARTHEHQVHAHEAALSWIATSTPPTAVVLAPPALWDLHYRMKRSTVASWMFANLEELPEWRARIESLIGKIERNENPTGINARFTERTEAQILDIQARFGGDFVLTRAIYSFPLVARFDPYHIYRLPSVDSAGSSQPRASVEPRP